MNILHVIDSMDPVKGGVCQSIRNILPALENIGVQNEVVCCDVVGASFLQKDRFLVHSLGVAKGPWHYHRDLLPWLLENFHRFDIVVLHGLWLYQGYAVKEALVHYKAKLRRQGQNMQAPKLFIMPHGMLDPYFQSAPGRKMKAIRNWIYWKLFESKVIKEADGLLFTSREELLLAQGTFRPYQAKRELVTGLGIEAPPARTYRMQEALLERCPALQQHSFILFLGRVHEKKGVGVLLRAYQSLLEEHVEKAYVLPKLLIAGPGLETAFGMAVQQLVAGSSSLKENVLFAGMLTGDAKWGALYACESFILPSHQENFGLAVVEAMACSKLVLLTDKVNIWREIETAGGGFVAKNTTKGIRQLFKKWIKLSTTERRTMGEQAKAAYEQLFTMELTAYRLRRAFQLKDQIDDHTIYDCMVTAKSDV